MSRFSFGFVLILFLSLTIFSSCTFVSQRFQLERPEKPHVYEKVWGVDLFKIKTDHRFTIKEMIGQGGYHKFSNKFSAEKYFLKAQELWGCKKDVDVVIELMSMPGLYFRDYERTDDYPRIVSVIDIKGYRSATLCELLSLGASYGVPYMYGGKIMALGSLSSNFEAFYIDRDDFGRRLLTKPVDGGLRAYNVWFAVVKISE